MIYFIQAGKNGPIKIGQTDNGVDDRLKQLQTGCPYELRLLWVYDGHVFSEKEIHERFSHERIRGEWFRPSRKILDFIDEELHNEHEIALANKKNFFVNIWETRNGVMYLFNSGNGLVNISSGDTGKLNIGIGRLEILVDVVSATVIQISKSAKILYER